MSFATKENVPVVTEDDADEITKALESQESDESDTDELTKMQNRIKEQTEYLNKDLKEWEKIKIQVLTENADLMDPVDENQEQKQAAKGKFLKFLSTVATFFEMPNKYLEDLISQTSPKSNELKEKLNYLVSELSDPTKSKHDLQKIRLDICETHISLINLHQSVFNNVNREIDYCKKWVAAIEKVVTTLLIAAVRLKLHVPVPDVDLEISKRYPMTLYNVIHSQTDKIEKFFDNVKGVFGKSKEAINKPSLKNNSFFSHHKKQAPCSPANDTVNHHKHPTLKLA